MLVNAKTILIEKLWYYLSWGRGYGGSYLSLGYQKVKVIVWLELEFLCLEVTIQHFSHYAMMTPLYIFMYICVHINVCLYILYACVYIGIWMGVCVCVCNHCVHALPHWGLSTLVKEFSAATRIMQSSSKELSTLVADRV